MTVSQALTAAAALGLDRLDAQLLLLQAVGRRDGNRAWLLAHDDDPLAPENQAAFLALARRRAAGEPLAYLTGHKEFFGLDLLVDERVLVPRPDTETLVEWALQMMGLSVHTGPCPSLSDAAATTQPEPTPAPTSAPTLIDLGTGSGAIALALKHARPDWQICAVDTSLGALAVAQANAQRLHLDVQFHQGSWLRGLRDRFHLIVSNPPYIAAQDAHLAALVHEPAQALSSGADGLDDIRQIIAQAPARLLPGGWLLLEHGYDQAHAVRSLLGQAGLQDAQSRPDLAGIERCSGARMRLA